MTTSTEEFDEVNKDEKGKLPPDDELQLMVAEQMRLRDETLALTVDETHPFPLLEMDNAAEMLKRRKIQQLRASAMGLDADGRKIHCD